MAQSETANFSTAITAREGGAVRVTMSSNVGQGNGGTTLPCRVCWVSATIAATAPTKVNVGAAASQTLGITLCPADVSQPLMIPVDDVAKLYFWSAGASDIVDIMWVI